MCVGELRTILNDLPDTMPVLIRSSGRIEAGLDILNTATCSKARDWAFPGSAWYDVADKNPVAPICLILE